MVIARPTWGDRSPTPELYVALGTLWALIAVKTAPLEWMRKSWWYLVQTEEYLWQLLHWSPGPLLNLEGRKRTTAGSTPNERHYCFNCVYKISFQECNWLAVHQNFCQIDQRLWVSLSSPQEQANHVTRKLELQGSDTRLQKVISLRSGCILQ